MRLILLPFLAVVAAGRGGRTTAPDAVDWIAAGVVLPVADEGRQEISWAIAAVEVLAASLSISKGPGTPLTNLSSQQLVDCASWGTLIPYTLSHGLCTAAEYSSLSGVCADAACAPAIAVVSWVNVVSNSEAALAAAVALQPVYVAVASSSPAFQAYTGGVLTSPECGTQPNHYLSLIGYNASATPAYWRGQNSWSAAWGEGGRVRLGRGSAFGTSGECGVQVQPMYPVVTV